MGRREPIWTASTLTSISAREAESSNFNPTDSEPTGFNNPGRVRTPRGSTRELRLFVSRATQMTRARLHGRTVPGGDNYRWVVRGVWCHYSQMSGKPGSSQAIY